MLSKRKCEEQVKVPAPLKFRKNVSGLFLSNQIAARRAASLSHDAQEAQGQGVPDLAALAADPNKPAKHRDVLKKLLKNRHWPQIYYLNAPVTDLRSQEEVMALVPMWLPHELVQCLQDKVISASGIHSIDLLEQPERQQLDKVSASTGIPVTDWVAISMWGDGVPFNNSRSHSLEMLSLAILSSHDHSLRLPLCAFPKHLQAGQKTWEAILSVVKWSLESSASGLYPIARHDGASFETTDRIRKRKAGQPLCRAALVQIRGDWSFYKNCFGLPGWNEVRSCCWRCSMTPAKISEVNSQSFWRQPANRKNHWQAVAALDKVSPVLGFPFFHMDMIQLDWLHIMDIGVTLQWLGSIFAFLLSKLPGRSKDENCKLLHQRMKQYYKDFAVDSQIPLLKLSMLYKDQSKKVSFPKLRAKAGEARGLVHFSLLQCQDLLNLSDPMEAALFHCAQHLDVCYQNLSKQAFETKSLQESAIKFATLYVSLNQAFQRNGQNFFKVTPKLHLFLEMTLDPCAPPSTGWTYRDEDWGGKMAELAKRRGGKLSCLAVGQALFHKFAASYDVPKL